MESLVGEFSPQSRFRWRIQNFSQLTNESYDSPVLMVGGCKWRLRIYPKGIKVVDHLSLYLLFVEDASTNKSSYAVYNVGFVNPIKNIILARKYLDHYFTTSTTQTSSSSTWGYRNFVRLSKFNDPSEGYLLNDTFTISLEISVCEMTEKFSKDDLSHALSPEMQLVEHSSSGAGEHFEGSQHDQQRHVFDDKYEDIGGFSVLKTQAAEYRQIWLKYGHIASSKAPIASSYIAQVWLVVDIMNTVMDMNKYGLPDVSSEMVGLWESKIKMAEELQFNVRWLRDQYEIVRKGFFSMKQKFKIDHIIGGFGALKVNQ